MSELMSISKSRSTRRRIKQLVTPLTSRSRIGSSTLKDQRPARRRKSAPQPRRVTLFDELSEEEFDIILASIIIRENRKVHGDYEVQNNVPESEDDSTDDSYNDVTDDSSDDVTDESCDDFGSSSNLELDLSQLDVECATSNDESTVMEVDSGHPDDAELLELTHINHLMTSHSGDDMDVMTSCCNDVELKPGGRLSVDSNSPTMRNNCDATACQTDSLGDATGYSAWGEKQVPCMTHCNQLGVTRKRKANISPRDILPAKRSLLPSSLTLF